MSSPAHNDSAAADSGRGPAFALDGPDAPGSPDAPDSSGVQRPSGPTSQEHRGTSSSGATAPSDPKALGRLPGIALAVTAGVASTVAGSFLPGMSPLLLAIIVGIVVANVVPLPAATAPGMTYSSKTLLRAGIVLLGLQVVLGDIVGLGIGMIAVVVVIVAVGILGTMLIGRLLGTPPVLTILVACGFSICGAAAVGAVAGVVDPEQKKDEDAVTAVALVALFGTLMIPLLPLAAGLLGLDTTTAGLWAGGGVHEVAQVVAVGGVLGGGALAVAVIVKLARVLMLAPVIAVLSIRARRAAGRDTRRSAALPSPTGNHPTTLPPIVPLFVAGFLAMVLVQSFIPLPEVVLTTAGLAQTLLLSTAMFALGCGVKAKTLVQVGVRPFVLAALSTLLVAGLALGGVLLVA
jgi:uncharacterized integral membrane protein (TIGR00698 family)